MKFVLGVADCSAARSLSNIAWGQSADLPIMRLPKNDLLSIARKSLLPCQRDIERLIDSTVLDDHYKLSILGSILSYLKDGEREIDRLAP